MNPFQSDNIWKKKARQGKAQQHPLTAQQEWQKQVNSSSLWLGGGVVLPLRPSRCRPQANRQRKPNARSATAM